MPYQKRQTTRVLSLIENHWNIFLHFLFPTRRGKGTGIYCVTIRFRLCLLEGTSRGLWNNIETICHVGYAVQCGVASIGRSVGWSNVVSSGYACHTKIIQQWWWWLKSLPEGLPKGTCWKCEHVSPSELKPTGFSFKLLLIVLYWIHCIAVLYTDIFHKNKTNQIFRGGPAGPAR